MKKASDFLSAIAFLTVIPVKKTTPWDDRGKLFYFPVVGFLIGMLLWMFDSISSCFLNDAGRSLADIIFLIIISGGLHLDGLADSFDGLFSHRDKDTVLLIMKDSRTGVFGVIAVLVVLACKWAGISSGFPEYRWIFLVFIPAFSRSAMLFGLTFMPYARKEGGIASELAGDEDGKQLALVLIPVLLPFFFNWRIAIAFNLITILIVSFWLYICHKKIEGVTGDTLGALGEIVEAALFFAGCVI